MTGPASIRLLDATAAGFEAEFDALVQRRQSDRASLQDTVAALVDDVRRRGDAAVLDAIERFDGYRPRADELEIGADEIEKGASGVAPADRGALAMAAERVARFHSYRLPASWTETADGETLGQLVRPLSSVALYVPAGSAPLASSVLMLGIPARVAGVPERVMTSPGRTLHPAVLEAARLAGLTRLFCVGGAQAIAALAYGTETIPRVDKILGPGNAYVQEAKRQVFGQVAIDSEAGPSEVFIVAESDAPPRLLAADLLAQAEHDPMSSVVLATPDAGLATRTIQELVRQSARLSRIEIVRKSLARHSAVIVTRSLEQAIDLANAYAPEHLQLYTTDPQRWLARVRNAGAVFVGPNSPVPLGDYMAGPSHVLPTGGTARFFSVVGVEDFVKRISLIEFDAAALARVGPAAARLADLEGLDAHARALRARLQGVD